MRRRILIAVLGMSALTVAVYVICAQDRVTSEQLRRQLDRELPEAPNRAAVEEWLRSHRCEWNYVSNANESKYSGAIRAVMHDSDECNAPLKHDIHMVFMFDADGRVSDRLVSEELAE